MPKRTYMQRDPRRDHGFTSPDPHLTLEHGVPNACSSCHEDQTLEWARDTFTQWYGETERRQRKRARAKAFARYEAGERAVYQDFLDLMKNEENAYWKATYLRILAFTAEQPEVMTLAQESIKSPEPIVREAALSIFAQRQDGYETVAAKLNDSSRLVRNRAADTLSSRYDPTQFAFHEWKDYAEMNADRPAGALRRAELATQQGDVALAEKLVENAINFDRNNARLLYDAAIMLDRLGKSDKALAKLDRAETLDPDYGGFSYAKGLLYAGKGDLAGSISALEKAVEKDATQDRWWYNLAVAYFQAGNAEKARDAIVKAIEINPAARDYHTLRMQIGIN